MTEKERNGTTSTSGASAPPYPTASFDQQQPYQYGTFQGVAYYTRPPTQPVVGFPQPAPPPGATVASNYYAQGYHTVPGYAVAEGRPLREPSPLCCGIGIGWVLFIAGFFLAGISWYVGALILVCGRLDYREKAGYVACMVATILAILAIVFGLTSDNDFW